MCSRLRGAETREWAGPRPLGRLWKEEVLPAPSSLGLRLPGVQSRVVVWPPPRLCGKEEGPHLSGVRTPVLASRTPWPAWGHRPGAAAIAVTPPRPLSAQGHARRFGIQVQLSLGLLCASPHSGPRFLCTAPCLPRLRLRCLCPLPGRTGSQGARVIGSSEDDVI